MRPVVLYGCECETCFLTLRKEPKLQVLEGSGYGLDDRIFRVRFPAGAGNFSLRHHVQIGSGGHPAS